MKEFGMKYDDDKPRMSLLPPIALESVASVLTFGSKKYGDNNWRYVDNAESRYLDAALRHISAFLQGEISDEESGLPHLSHAICCLMFIVDMDEDSQKRDDERETTDEELKEIYDKYRQRLLDIIRTEVEEKLYSRFPNMDTSKLDIVMRTWNKKESE